MDVHIEHIVKVMEVHILEEYILVAVHIVDIVEIKVYIEDIVEVTVEFMVEVIRFDVKKYMIKNLVVNKSWLYKRKNGGRKKMIFLTLLASIFT